MLVAVPVVILTCCVAMFAAFPVFVAGLPGPPLAASVIEISPTTVLLNITPPVNNGGVAIYGYRIQYLLKIDDFMIGIINSQFYTYECAFALFE